MTKTSDHGITRVRGEDQPAESGPNWLKKLSLVTHRLWLGKGKRSRLIGIMSHRAGRHQDPRASSCCPLMLHKTGNNSI
ncbi:MAG: hypothetical protein QHD01_13720 [Bradyrhizobium sp.]|uniref:hypothetical protein n=1 Tax=Bradyrhizobium sp. TaxID=376 RepID=UPI0029A5CC73|nr:hypothetical protein [Bradyrhizobium sp.]MDX3967647.1 hypothetical protein [Bradyrhizobium sp.]